MTDAEAPPAHSAAMPSTRLNTFAMAAFAAVALSFNVAPSIAQTTYKCIDAAGDITYSGKQCSSLGLKEVGEVRERLSVIPAPDVSRRTPSQLPHGRNTANAAPPATQAPPAVIVPPPTARR